MTEIKPFKAVGYNPDKIGDFSKVVCPPYDVISPEAQERYHRADPHNLIHVLLRKDAPDKYAQAGETFRQWLKQDILTQDEHPAIYFYSQQYKLKGETRSRLGFIALLRLAEGRSTVFAHEHTRKAPKEDRLQLIRSVRANLSPIFAVFPDSKRIIQRVYQVYVAGARPQVEVTDEEHTLHQLWRIDSPKALELMQEGMRGEDVFIADGHHRYEVAGLYREEQRERSGKLSGNEDFNYILTYFTKPDPRGLLVLPIHRLVSLDERLDLAVFKNKAEEYFAVEEFRDKNQFFFLMAKGGITEHLIGMYKDGRYLLLRLKNVRILDKLMSDKPAEYRVLDTAIFNHLILKGIFGFDPEAKDNLTFSHSAEEFIAAADRDPLSVAFFLNPVKVEQIMAVALKGERMPPKSTFFYPKVLSGLVIHKFGEEDTNKK